MCQWGVRQSAEVENQMVSVERVMEYTQLEPEASLETPKGKTPPPNDWPSSGEIIFEHVQLKYGNEEPVLKDITCVIKPSEKVCLIKRLINLKYLCMYMSCFFKLYTDWNSR